MLISVLVTISTYVLSFYISSAIIYLEIYR